MFACASITLNNVVCSRHIQKKVMHNIKAKTYDHGLEQLVNSLACQTLDFGYCQQSLTTVVQPFTSSVHG